MMKSIINCVLNILSNSINGVFGAFLVLYSIRGHFSSLPYREALLLYFGVYFVYQSIQNKVTLYMK